MKKNLEILLLMILVFCIISCSVKHNNDLIKLNLNGKIKSIKSTLFEVVENSGQIIKGKEKKIYSDESENNYQYVLFNESGMITESLLRTMGARDECEIRSFYKYNKKGLIIEKREDLGGGIYNNHDECITTFIFDDKDLLIEEKTVSNNFEINSISTKNYKYDKNGYKIEEKNTSLIIDKKSNKIIQNNEFVMYFKNDDSGCKIEEYNTSNKTTFLYDSKKELIEKQQYSILNDGKISLNETTTFKYDTKGKLTDQTNKNSNGKLISWKTYNYNENGFISEVISFDSFRENNNKDSFKYEYDKNKNWIKKTTFFKDKPETIEEREIVYY